MEPAMTAEVMRPTWARLRSQSNWMKGYSAGKPWTIHPGPDWAKVAKATIIHVEGAAFMKGTEVGKEWGISTSIVEER